MGWGWGGENEEEERRKRKQEEELRRRKEEHLKKTRAADDARRKAKEAKKAAIAAKHKKLQQQSEMDKEINGLMEGMGAESLGYDKKEKAGGQTNTLARGMLDNIFGAGSGGGFNGNRGNGSQISAPGKPIIGFQRDQKDNNQQTQKEDTFSGKPTTKLWRPL